MSNTLHVIQSALDDVQKALDWYESQSTGLEQRFHKTLMERLNFIKNYPEAAAFLDKRFRGVKLKNSHSQFTTTMTKLMLSSELELFYIINATNPFLKSVFNENAEVITAAINPPLR